MPNVTAGFRNSALGSIIEAGNTLDPANLEVGLFVSMVDNGLDTAMTDFSLPPATLADREDLTAWGSPHTLIDGRRVVDGPAIVFTPASSAEATVVAGWYLYNSLLLGNLLFWGLFPEPVPLPDENFNATVIVRFTLDPAARWEATVSING